PLEVLRRRDGGDDERTPERRPDQILDHDAVARRVELSEIVDEALPLGELALFADLEPEDCLGRRDGRVTPLEEGRRPPRLSARGGRGTEQEENQEEGVQGSRIHSISA